MERTQANTELAIRLVRRIGLNITPENVKTDETGWHFFITKKSLERNCPLILAHYRRFLFVVIPHEDMDDIVSEKITVDEYIDQSHWSYGYYSEKGDTLNSVFWRPFEESGITEAEKIAAYLQREMCRNAYINNKPLPKVWKCEQCVLQHCPVSPNKTKKSNDPDERLKELSKFDPRFDLYRIVKENVKAKYGYDTDYCVAHEFSQNRVIIFPSTKSKTVDIYLPANILAKMLCYPHKYNPEEVASTLSYVIGKYEIIPGREGPIVKYKPLTEQDTSEAIENYWGVNLVDWVIGENSMMHAAISNAEERKSLFDRFRSAFTAFWE